jgi:thiol-disulfide isomerase/thioredoxin
LGDAYVRPGVAAALQLGGLLLAGVFATAGVAKLADLEGSRKAVAAFGVPRRLASLFGTLLPTVELATAALLAAGALIGRGEVVALRAGALSALALISLFCAAIAVSIARGRAPDCHCFGQLHSAPASKRTLIRNGALLTLAAFVAGGGDPTWPVGAAAAMLATLVLVGLLNLRGEQAAEADEGLPHGTAAPDFELPSLGGSTVSLAALRGRGRGRGRPVLLVFSSPACGPCIALAPRIANWQSRYASELTIAVVERRDGSERAGPDEHGRRDVLLQRDREVADSYRAEGTPAAVLVSEDGHIASGIAAGPPAIEALLARTLPDFQAGDAQEPVATLPAPFARREFLARAVAAWAGVMGLLSAPAWATVIPVELKCRYERCGNRCCPRKARCRRQGSRRICVCPDGRPACGDRCCPDTFECRSFRRRRRLVRRCACPIGYVVCAGRCVRTTSNPRHCGRCGTTCPPATSCVQGRCTGGDGSGSGPGGSGACTCPLGETCCEGRCTDLNTSNEHCGRCGQRCREGETCCEGRCLKLENDPQNCGRCGKRCATGEVCAEGECRRRCPSGQTNCKGRCTDPQSDPDNCGKCGSRCTGATDTGECCRGGCCSYNAQTCCPSGCVNTSLDDQNCGGCGVVCGPNSYCRFGVCTCPVSPCP